MTLTVRPGCFGSAVFYLAGSSECEACEVMKGCTQRVAPREAHAMEFVKALDARFGTETAPRVTRWWLSRWKADDAPARALARSKTVLERWSASGVNIYLVKHRINPCTSPDSDPHLREALAFVISEGPFKPRDMIEHLRDKFPDTSKSYCTAFVKEVCGALETASIVKRENRGVLCLTN